jgi:hypothetical protein
MTDSVLSESEIVAAFEAKPHRFPSVAGIFLGASLCLHLAALVYLVFGNTLPAATCFICGQFLAGISIIRLVDGAFVFQDIRLFFLIFFFLYGATLPLLVALKLAGGTPGMDGAAFMYGTAIFAFNVVQWWYRQPWHDIPKEVFARYRPSFANAVAVFLGFAAVLGYALWRGITFSLTIDRGRVNFLGTQTWVVLMFVVNGLMMYMILGWRQLTKQARTVLVASMTAFIALQISMGNRRDFLPMFIMLAGVVAARRHAIIRVRTIIIGLFLFAALTILGVLRQVINSPMLLASDPVTLLVTQNEFVSPIQTLMYYVAKPHALRLGSTYFTAPLLFIPRVFWPDKPESLSLQYMRDAFGTIQMMGYAYTPVTEAVLNFGFVGPFIVFGILSILMVKLVKNADMRPGFYFICFALVVDFNRGDVGGLFYSIVCMGAAFWFMSIVSRMRWAPKAIRDTWPASPPGDTAQVY